ncbi:centrosomal protein of 170 kDa protein B isoform X2 [Parambassis ranga]|uniref:Centrosomal protein of 170 kDa protein B isoform X2 n=1 Tax=Parambassis ranga TaxID=210632 RepID=A0A6P7H6T0_9TELE|nr:centrosomal protein of 170 kDa protein B-like isoform X2 [Parambassis ranga]
MSVTSWFLVSSSGTRHRLPREMIFVGREDCELMLQSRSVDKQHAVINYDPNTDEHMVKDLGSLNGTFVNDLRIPDQTYITLKLSDVIRFGYDAHVYILEKSQHKVPEEALKHEKYTSQLQLNIKALEAKAKEKQQLHSSDKSKDTLSNVKLQDRTERRAHSLTASTDSPISKPTPLYGQPSWWGEDEDPANKKQNRGGKSPEQESPEPAKDVSRYEVNGSLSDSQAKSIFSCRREPSYFEIPTKEFQQRLSKKPETQVHEVPTKDTPDPSQCVPSTPTPPVVQSHASFTIEFDECTPGKMKIKDHVTKFSLRQQRKQPSTEVVTTPTEVMSPENKVADWLVQSNASMMRRRKSQAEDMYSTTSDPSFLKMTKANHFEDGSHSDSGHPLMSESDFLQSEPNIVSPQTQRASPPQRFASPDSREPPSHSPPESQSISCVGQAEPHQAFVIEFFDDNPKKKRSQSFTNNTSPPEPSGLSVQKEKSRKSSSPTGERQFPPSSSTPPTQRYTIPLKDPVSSGPQRAGSLRREKTEDRISTSFSSRSASCVSARLFCSVGRRSKLTQEFTAELVKQQEKQNFASWEKNISSPSRVVKQETVVLSQSDQSCSTSLSDSHHHPKTSSPIHQPVPLKAPVMPLESKSVEVRSPQGGLRNEEDDSLSDAGTYTIEADVQDKELEDARSRIDQVFGVVETPERTNLSDASSAFRPVVVQDRGQHRQSSCGEVRPAPEQGQSLVKPAEAVLQGAPKWMSCWASLAESGPSSGLFDSPSQMELSGGAQGTIIKKTTLSRNHSTDSEGSRTRRILPQVPLGEKSDIPTPGIHVHYDPHSTFDAKDNSVPGPKSEDGIDRLTVQDDVEPDSLSDASKSDDGSIVEQRQKLLSNPEEKQNEDKPKLQAKSTSFYIGSEEAVSKTEYGGSKPSTPKFQRKPVTKTFSTATLTKQRGSQDSEKIKPTLSAPLLSQERQSPELKEGTVFPLIRQESFTKERPSSARLPNISSQTAQRHQGSELFQGVSSQDTHSYLKETEDVLAVLEAKIQAGQSVTTPSPIMDSLSGESDVDTSSTVSQHSSKTKPNPLTKKTSVSGLHREKSSASITCQDSKHQPILEKQRFQRADSSKTESVKRPVGLRRSVGKCGSTDLSDDPQSLPYSDQESNNHQASRKYKVPLQKEDGKSSKVLLNRTNSLSAPRPTRASMLRRARLGDASDNEGAETDRLPHEAPNLPGKQPQEAKKLSRLDMLAMPRKRTSSFNTPSDTEASSTPQWTGKGTGFSSRSTEGSGSSVRRASAPGTKPVERPQKPQLCRTPVTRVRSGSAKYASSTASSRRRQKGSDYTSTSDEEYDSNQSTPKHKRSQPSSASHSPRSQPRPQPVVALRPKSGCRDSEEESNEGEALYSWSNHSAEIARLSQDLAKDLAILAREIHDVAGEGDPQNPGVDCSVPVSTVTAHEQLIQRIPEAGLNYQRTPPSSAPTREPDHSSSDHEQHFRRLARSRDEVTVDNLLLNPVSQVIVAIRENTEQLADKIKVLFQDRMDIWEEIEAKVNSDNDVPVVKTPNKEISSILKELRRVQRQLEVINTVMEPSGPPEPTKTSHSSGLRSSRAPPSRDWRTVHSVSKRGGGPRPSESVRKAAVTPDDLREGYLV